METDDFLRDIALHQMQVIRDDGVNRHLRFKRPGTMCMHFDLITWPGYLCYTGDMGTYVFRRLPDMFEFFRHGGTYPLYSIDRRYWAEKVEAQDKGDGLMEFSAEKFRERVKEQFDDYAEGMTEAARADLWRAVQSYVINTLDDDRSGRDAYRAAMDFEHDKHRPFGDLWEADCRVFTHRFTWCCHALRWAIAAYDAAATQPVAA